MKRYVKYPEYNIIFDGWKILFPTIYFLPVFAKSLVLHINIHSLTIRIKIWMDKKILKDLTIKLNIKTFYCQT